MGQREGGREGKPYTYTYMYVVLKYLLFFVFSPREETS